MKRSAALIIFSGGQDSTICLFWARQKFDCVHALSFDYGQRHNIELEAARHIGQLAGVSSHEVLPLPSVLSSTSPLVDENQKLEEYKDFETMEATVGERVESTFVPMRNALFLTIAANRAVCHGIYHLITGVCQADNANYPDCRETFIQAQQKAIETALGIDCMQIHTPLLFKNKAESIQWSLTIPGAYEALAWTHTAYDGLYPPQSRDHASLLRAWGFEKAGLPDPLILRAWQEDKMPLPSTSNYAPELVHWAVEERGVCKDQAVPSAW